MTEADSVILRIRRGQGRRAGGEGQPYFYSQPPVRRFKQSGTKEYFHQHRLSEWQCGRQVGGAWIDCQIL